ncbi:helix-turn-helix domain-containing protein [Streptomyces sp. AP-93]|uniref:helix-turn-helix domain-containing protein n=1 Tax=Streptomyces sp. AP-93 TaxID=2929048 RepID=UPI0027E3CFCD|nr:helix-turn-helix domain-containing protein [Streptomyces sp. AP-93]
MTQSVTELGLPTPKERRRLREAADLTHEEVAAAVGVTSNTVRSWETGRTHPRGRKLEAYSKLLSRLSTDESAGSAPSGPTARTDGSGPTARTDGSEGGSAQGGGDSAGAAGGASTGTPTRPAWVNGTATPQAGAAQAGSSGVGSSGVGSSGGTGTAGADTDAASAPGIAPGSPLDSDTEHAGAATGAASADADAVSAADAPEGRFGLRMMRGPTRPVGAQTRPKAAVKRASKPPVGVPRHEAKSAVKAGAALGGGHGGGGFAALRPGGSLPPGAGTGTAPDTGSGAGPDSGPHSGTTAAPAGPGSTSATGPGQAGPDTGPAAGADPAPAAGKAAAKAPAPDSASAAEDAGPADPEGGAGRAGGPAAKARTAPEDAPQDAPGEDAPTVTAVSAFDALYNRTAPALARQAFLLTGRHALACEAVERAFQQAWERWPEVATDPDPVGWVRAATYEYALSPWHRFRRSHRHPDKPPADPADRVLLDAMLGLPPAHRRTVLLYDGVGLDLPDTAAETEASTPTAGSRLVNAHADLADQLPELDGVAPAKQSAVLRDRLGTLRPALRLEPRAAAVVRMAGEHRTRLWTRAVIGVTAAIAAATAYTWVTAPTEYEPPRSPGASVSGVPPHSGPQQLTDEGRQLHDKLLSDPSAGPSRIAPSLE